MNLSLRCSFFSLSSCLSSTVPLARVVLSSRIGFPSSISSIIDTRSLRPSDLFDRSNVTRARFVVNPKLVLVNHSSVLARRLFLSFLDFLSLLEIVRRSLIRDSSMINETFPFRAGNNRDSVRDVSKDLIFRWRERERKRMFRERKRKDRLIDFYDLNEQTSV